MPEPIDASFLRPNEANPVPPFPQVSVIIPAFNAAGLVITALASVFAQTFADYEVILINDGSSDTARLEQVIQPYTSQIFYLRQENRGPSAARNLGIRQARGEWLAFLDSDDAWMPNYLAEQFKFLEGDPSLDMVFCDATVEGGGGAVGKTFMQLCPSTGPVTFESLLIEKTQVITSGTIVRKRRAEAAGLFDEEIYSAEDHDLWLRVSHAGGRISYQRQVLLHRNLRRDSQGSTPNLLAGEIHSLKKLDRDLILPPGTRLLLAERLKKIQAELALVEGRESLLAGDVDKAYEALSRANALAPTTKLRAVLAGLRIAPHLTIIGGRLLRGRNLR